MIIEVFLLFSWTCQNMLDSLGGHLGNGVQCGQVQGHAHRPWEPRTRLHHAEHASGSHGGGERPGSHHKLQVETRSPVLKSCKNSSSSAGPDSESISFPGSTRCTSPMSDLIWNSRSKCGPPGQWQIGRSWSKFRREQSEWCQVWVVENMRTD